MKGASDVSSAEIVLRTPLELSVRRWKIYSIEGLIRPVHFNEVDRLSSRQCLLGRLDGGPGLLAPFQWAQNVNARRAFGL